MPTSTTQLATTRDVTAAIQSLGLATTTDALAAIGRVCREEFLEHLATCVSGNDEDGTHRKAIESLLRCLSPSSLAKLKAVVPDVTADRIVPVARKAPARFLSALDAGNDTTHARHAEAVAMLQAAFVPAESSAPEETTTSARPAPTPSSGTPVSASPASQKYHSCHVYGGSFCLCFNAGEWNGKPGIMVDAATTSGPKSRPDWENAIHIWLDIREVGAVLAVFRRWRKSVEFAAHGARHDKSFSLECQGKHFYAKVSARKADSHPVRAVQILPTDATTVQLLFLNTLIAAYPDLPVSELMASLRAAHVEHGGTT